MPCKPSRMLAHRRIAAGIIAQHKAAPALAMSWREWATCITTFCQHRPAVLHYRAEVFAHVGARRVRLIPVGE